MEYLNYILENIAAVILILLLWFLVHHFVLKKAIYSFLFEMHREMIKKMGAPYNKPGIFELQIVFLNYLVHLILALVLGSVLGYSYHFSSPSLLLPWAKALILAIVFFDSVRLILSDVYQTLEADTVSAVARSMDNRKASVLIYIRCISIFISVNVFVIGLLIPFSGSIEWPISVLFRISEWLLSFKIIWWLTALYFIYWIGSRILIGFNYLRLSSNYILAGLKVAFTFPIQVIFAICLSLIFLSVGTQFYKRSRIESVKKVVRIFSQGGEEGLIRQSELNYSYRCVENVNIVALKRCAVFDITSQILIEPQLKKKGLPPSEYFNTEAFQYRTGPSFMKLGLSRDETNHYLYQWEKQIRDEISDINYQRSSYGKN